MSKVTAIILAGGKGKRMGADISKQYININGKPILYYTLKRFNECENIDEIILVVPKDEIEYCENEIVNRYSLKVDKIIEGGAERQDSVYNGLSSIDDAEIVLIHDGARPFVSKEIINNGVTNAKKYGATACGVMPKDTIKIISTDGFSIETPDRSKLMAVQTPQCFSYKIIKKAHQYVKNNNIKVTDDTMAVELLGNKVYLYEGDYTNIKVTTPEDLILAEKLAKELS